MPANWCCGPAVRFWWFPPQLTGFNFKCAIIAWKDTREARRAVSDALPLLHQVEQVIVAEIVQEQSAQTASKARLDDVAEWLVRRGIAAASVATKELIGVTGQIEIMAQDEGADVIVAGAYGHTRLTEWVFGGVTRDLLAGKRSVLLSH